MASNEETGARTLTRPKSRKGIVVVEIPIPELGETAEMWIDRYGLTILVERDKSQTQEDVQARFCVVAPITPDTRTHAARVGAGAMKGKKVGTTLCKEAAKGPQPVTGTRIALPLDAVLCVGCRKILTEDGVELKELT